MLTSPKSFQQWEQFSKDVHAIASRVSSSLDIEARKLGEVHGFGYHSCYHHAHNWLLGNFLTQEQVKAAKRILYLQDKSWEPYRIASRIVERAFKRVV